jgi:hypothetical protein
VSLLLAGYDDNGPQLYQVDPSGTYFAWKASAIGKNMVNAKTFLEKRYSEDVEVEDAVHTALLTLKESFEGEMTGYNIEVRSWPCISLRRSMHPSGWHFAANLSISEKRCLEDVEVEDVHTALLTPKESFDGGMRGQNVEVCLSCCCCCG